VLIPITKVEIVGWHRHVEAVLDALHQLRLVQLLDISEENLPLRSWSVEDAQVRQADTWRLLQARLDALLGLLPSPVAPDDDVEPFDPAELPALQAELDEMAPEIEGRVRELDGLKADLETLPRHIRALRKLMPLVPAVVELERYETVALLLDARHPVVLALLRRELEDLVDARFEIVSARVDSNTLGAVLAFPRSESAHVHALLGRERVSPVQLPTELGNLPLDQAVAAMEARLAELPDRITVREGALHSRVREHQHRWEAARRFAAGRSAQLAELEKLGTTGHAFVLRGWTPVPAVAHLETAVTEAVGPAVIAREVPVGPEEWDRVPVLLHHPGISRPFGFLLELYALPRTGSFDPTWLMTLFLPLFFGMMLGDVGYAAVIALVAWIVRRTLGRRSTAWRYLTSVLLLGSLSGAIFGVAFGEFFGSLGRPYGLHPLWLDREEAIVPLLLITIATGVAHVVLGLLLGVWGAVKHHQRMHLVERLGLLVALFGALALAGRLTGRLPQPFLVVGASGLGVGVLAVLVANGVLGLLLGPLEVLRTLGNVLSYLRIAALGLASVYLARTANELGAMGPLWLGIIVAVLLHALNIVLGAFSPTIQALRLHYVEFFGQFYDEGGRPFVPFGAGAPSTGGGATAPREEAACRRA